MAETTSKSIKKTTVAQFTKLVALMEKNPKVAKGLGTFGSSKKTNKEMWEQFTIELNSLGPPMRDGRGWNKVWLDYKLKLKKKISANKRETVATGGGPYTQLSLSPLEQVVASLLNIQQAVVPSGLTFGPSSSASAAVPATSDCEEISGDSDEALQPTPKRRKRSTKTLDERENERLELLKAQSSTQSEMLAIAKNIQQNLADLTQFTRELLQLKKEKLEMAKQKELRKEKENCEKTQRHKAKLEWKLRELQLKEMKYNKK